MVTAEIPREGPTGEKRTFHSLRHTFARVALENGAELTWLSRHLGHSSTMVTDTVYGHWARGRARGRLGVSRMHSLSSSPRRRAHPRRIKMARRDTSLGRLALRGEDAFPHRTSLVAADSPLRECSPQAFSLQIERVTWSAVQTLFGWLLAVRAFSPNWVAKRCARRSCFGGAVRA
jgi:hypothetical protein